MVGWLDRWMDGWMDGWTDGWMEGWKVKGGRMEWMDGWMKGLGVMFAGVDGKVLFARLMEN